MHLQKIKHEGCVERQIQHSASPRAVFVWRLVPECFIFHTDKLGGALIDILYFRFASALSCLNKIDGMHTSFYNLSTSLKLMLRVNFLAERDNFLLHQCCDFIL